MLSSRRPSSWLVAMSLALPLAGCAGFARQKDNAALVGDARKGLGMEEMMAAWGDLGQVGEEHQLLAKLAGSWRTAGQWWMQPGTEPMEMPGEATKTLVLGGRFVREEFRTTSEEMPFEGIGYTGFDRVKGKYVGSWIDTMTTFQFTSESSPTENGFEGSGKMYDPVTKSWYDSRYKVTVASADSHTMEYWEPGPGGVYYKAMEIVYTRRN